MTTFRILVLGLLMTFLGYVHVQANILTENNSYLEPLGEMIQLTESEGLDVREWQLFARQPQGTVSSKQSFIQQVHKLNQKLAGWDVQEPQVDEAEWTASAELHHPELDLTESLRIFAYPSNGKQLLSYSYKIKGHSLATLRSQEVEQLLQERLKEFSLQQTTVFTQLKAMMPSSYHRQIEQSARQIVTALGAKEIEELKEETFVSISAYNKKWEDTIVTNNNKMNLQVAIRQDLRLGSGTTVTIGTPIITTEY